MQWLEICYVGCIIIEWYCTAYYYYFSAMVSPNIAAGQDSKIPVLEDISQEEVEMARAGKRKEMTPKVAKLKVPQK